MQQETNRAKKGLNGNKKTRGAGRSGPEVGHKKRCRKLYRVHVASEVCGLTTNANWIRRMKMGELRERRKRPLPKAKQLGLKKGGRPEKEKSRTKDKNSY